MMSARGFAMLGALAAMGFVLSGCGGGDDSASTPKFEFASQSFEADDCTTTSDSSGETEDFPVKMKFNMDLDMKELKLRTSANMKLNMTVGEGGGGYTIFFDNTFGAIYDASAKRLTSYKKDNSGEGNIKEECVIFDIAKEAKEVTDCLATTAAAMPRDGDMVTVDKAPQEVKWEVDDKNAIKKAVTTEVKDMKKPDGTTVKVTTIVTCPRTAGGAGIPETSIFEVPASWTNCTKSTFAAKEDMVNRIALPDAMKECMGVPKPTPAKSAVATFFAVNKEKRAHAKKEVASVMV